MESIKTREWIGIIGFVVIVEFMILYISFDVGGSNRALGYVSFAGTVVSIILGVIAILYSFYQSHSQSNVVGDIKDNAIKIVEAGNHIVTSKDSLFSSAGRLMALAEDLSLKLKEHNDHNIEFKGLLTEGLRGIATGGGQAGGSGNDIFSTSYYFIDMCYVMIGEYVKKGLTYKDFVDRLVNPVSKEFDVKESFVEGSVAVLILLLESQNMIKTKAEGDAEGEKAFFEGVEFKERSDAMLLGLKEIEAKPPVVENFLKLIEGLS